MTGDPTRAPWRPGSWVVARLTRFDVTMLTVVLASLALSRAWDYATPPPWVHLDPRPSPGLSVVEAAAPMWLWVTVLTTPAVALIVAALLRIHAGVWAGHAVLFVLYAALAGGYIAQYIVLPWADGIRSATVLILPAALHLLIAVRMGWRPRTWTTP